MTNYFMPTVAIGIILLFFMILLSGLSSAVNNIILGYIAVIFGLIGGGILIFRIIQGLGSSLEEESKEEN